MNRLVQAQLSGIDLGAQMLAQRIQMLKIGIALMFDDKPFPIGVDSRDVAVVDWTCGVREVGAPPIHWHDATAGWPAAAPRKADLVLLDPPYWKQAAGRYSNEPNELAEMTQDAFNAAWLDVAQTAVHRFYAPMQIDGRTLRVKLTVLEYKQNRQGFKNLQLAEIETPAGHEQERGLGADQSSAGGRVGNTDAVSIVDLLRGAKRDSDGQPFAPRPLYARAGAAAVPADQQSLLAKLKAGPAHRARHPRPPGGRRRAQRRRRAQARHRGS